MTNNWDYFSRRAAEEQAAAGRASDSRARDAHLEMARRYQAACAAPPMLNNIDEPAAAAEVPVRNITILPGSHG